MLQAGVSEVDITPPLGLEMAGYGPYEKRLCTEILDPLYVRALWLDSSGVRLLLITLDLIGIDLPLRNNVAGRIERACAIPAENVFLAASHTHSGPVTQPMLGWGECDPAYTARLAESIVQAAAQARARAVPARLGCERQRVQGVGVNREQPALGPTDTGAQLLRVDRADGSALAAVVNFGAHGVARYPYTARISADWPGLFTAALKLTLGVDSVLFLQGPCANINAHTMDFQRDAVAERQKAADTRTGDVAMRLFTQVLPALQALETRPEPELRAVWTPARLPCVRPDASTLNATIERNRAAAERITLDALRPLHERMLNETPEEKKWRQARFEVDAARRQLELLEQGRDAVEAPIHVLRLGDAALVGWPGEIDVELGIELRQRSPIPLTFVSSFANDNVGYIPTPMAYESQGRPNQFGRYPTQITPLIYQQLPFRPDVGRILVEESLRLLG
jgi:hypothetical protein